VEETGTYKYPEGKSPVEKGMILFLSAAKLIFFNANITCIRGLQSPFFDFKGFFFSST
jgi:hypothetical protein